jgi:glucose/arabinose dehydrogenase
VPQRAGAFLIRDIAPVDGAFEVPLSTAVQAHVSERFDPATVSSESVRLWYGSERVPARVTSDLGGVVSISPEAPLRPDAEYRVEITAALKSAAGVPLTPFTARFRTTKAEAARALSLPPFRKTKIGVAQGMTSLALGPDGGLYAATWEGRILRWQLDSNSGRPLGEPQEIWRPAATRITALCFDPDAARNRHLWVALDDNAGASVCELRFTARIVRLTLPERGGVLEARDFIAGLPVGDHAISGLTFAPDGRLTFFCGAITMLGGEKKGARETPLSAAVLVADVRAPEFAKQGPVDVSSKPPRHYDPRVPGAPVRIFATGIREAYDLCWHSNGRLYAGVNQNDTGEFSPANATRNLPAITINAPEPLIRIVEGKYYGHPNPSRDEWVLMGGNPSAAVDPWEIAKLPVGTQPEPGFDSALLLKDLVPLGGQSADGCAEWRGPGALHGRMLSCFYTTARTIHTFAFNPEGTRVVAEEPLCDETRQPLKFGAPLDLVIDDAHGRIYVADFADKRRKDSAGEGALWLVEEIR